MSKKIVVPYCGRKYCAQAITEFAAENHRLSEENKFLSDEREKNKKLREALEYFAKAKLVEGKSVPLAINEYARAALASDEGEG